MLDRAMDLVGKSEIPARRQYLYQWLAAITTKQLGDETILQEMGDLVDEFNNEVKRKYAGVLMRESATFLGAAASTGAALRNPLAPIPIAATALIGSVLLNRVDRGSDPPVGQQGMAAAAFLAEARSQMGK